jgi:hypothetical protein
VAHEVNNMMTVITGFSGFLEGALAGDDPRADDVAEIRRAADRAASITRQLLAYSRQQLLQPTPLDLNALVRQSVPVLTRLLGTGVRLELGLARELARIRADPAQLEQVLVNLVLNARDAMAGKGTLTVATETVVIDEARRQHSPGVRMPPGRYARLIVSDTGHGMDALTRTRIFEPFFTTKPSGQGSGLGLATVYGIVKQSGGFIWVYSEVGQGTAFKIYLPEFTGPTSCPPARRRARRAAQDLIVEMSVVRRMAARATRDQATILEVEGSAEALGSGAPPVPWIWCDGRRHARLNGRSRRRLAASAGNQYCSSATPTTTSAPRDYPSRLAVPQKPFMPTDCRVRSQVLDNHDAARRRRRPLPPHLRPAARWYGLQADSWRCSTSPIGRWISPARSVVATSIRDHLERTVASAVRAWRFLSAGVRGGPRRARSRRRGDAGPGRPLRLARGDTAPPGSRPDPHRPPRGRPGGNGPDARARRLGARRAGGDERSGRHAGAPAAAVPAGCGGPIRALPGTSGLERSGQPVDPPPPRVAPRRRPADAPGKAPGRGPGAALRRSPRGPRPRRVERRAGAAAGPRFSTGARRVFRCCPCAQRV